MAATTFLWAIAYSSPPRLNFAQRLCVAYWFFVEREPQISSCCAFAVSTFSRIVVCSAPLLHYCERFHEKRSKRNAQLEDLQWSLNCERLLCVCCIRSYNICAFASENKRTGDTERARKVHHECEFRTWSGHRTVISVFIGSRLVIICMAALAAKADQLPYFNFAAR